MYVIRKAKWISGILNLNYGKSSDGGGKSAHIGMFLLNYCILRKKTRNLNKIPSSMKRLAIWLFLQTGALFAYLPLSGQEMEVTWMRHFGGSARDEPRCTLMMPDSSLITVGHTASEDADITDTLDGNEIMISRQNLAGDFLWIKTFGGSAHFDVGRSVVICNDTSFLVAAYSDSQDGDIEVNYGNHDIVLLCIDLNGNVIWQRNYGGSNADSPYEIIKDLDGGFVICGTTSSNDNDVAYLHGTEEDIWVFKIDSAGNLIWESTFGSYDSDFGEAIIQLEDSSFIVAGVILDDGGDVSDFYGESDAWIIRISHFGEIIWEHNYGGTNTDDPYGLSKWGNGKLLMCGNSRSSDIDLPDNNGNTDAWLLMLDTMGNIIWSENYGSSEGDQLFCSGTLNSTTIIATGFSTFADFDVSENFGGQDIWTVLVDSNGTLLNEKSIGGEGGEYYTSITVINTTTAFFCGYSNSDDEFLPDNYGDLDAISALYTICYNKFFIDADGDGFGDSLTDTIACFAPPGFVADSTDCADAEFDINPGVKETCNYLDDDCDGELDEGFTLQIYYADADGDDYGAAASDSLACFQPAGFVSDSSDCDDTNPDIYPGATELLNGLDDDCDGQSDEGLSISNKASATVNIYPIPATTEIFIEFPITSVATLCIYNNSGGIVHQNNQWTGEAIDVNTLPSAIYFLQIIEESKMASGYFVKE